MVGECYIIMPFKEMYNELYLKGILPAVEKCFGSKSCGRADRVKHVGIITDKIVEGILNSKIIIAVITDANPNVMYELGLAHSFRKPTIMLISKNEGQKIPFDIGAQEAIFYEYDFESSTDDRIAQLQVIRDQIVEYITNFQEGKLEPTNPITSSLQDRYYLVDDLRSWLWGFRNVYKREQNAKTVWEMTSNPHWITRDKLFNKQIEEGIRNDTRRYYFLIPRSGHDIAELENFVRILKDTLGEENIEKVERCLKYVAIDPKFFELITFPVVIYDACYGVKADAIVCEPMAPEVGQDKHFDEKLMGIDTNSWDNLPSTELWKEKWFDIRLDEQKVRALTWIFTNLWNERIDFEISQAEDREKKRYLRDNWRI